MTRMTAEKVIQGLLAATAALNDTLLIVQAEAPGNIRTWIPAFESEVRKSKPLADAAAPVQNPLLLIG